METSELLVVIQSLSMFVELASVAVAPGCWSWKGLSVLGSNRHGSGKWLTPECRLVEYRICLDNFCKASLCGYYLLSLHSVSS